MKTSDHWVLSAVVVFVLLLVWGVHDAHVAMNVHRWHNEQLSARRAQAAKTVAPVEADKPSQATDSKPQEEARRQLQDRVQLLFTEDQIRRQAAALAAVTAKPPIPLVGGQIHQPSPARVQALRAALQAQAFVRTNILPYDLRRKACISRAHGK